MSYNQNRGEDYAKNSADRAGDKLKEARQDVFGKTENEKTVGDKVNEKLQENKPVMDRVGDYTKNAAEKAGDKMKETKEEVFGKAEKDKTIGDKVNEKLERDKPLAERVGDYAKNSAQSAGESMKNAKEKLVGKSEDDKTLGDKANEKIDNPDEKPIMEKVGTYISNTYDSAAESLKNAKQQIIGKSQDDKTLGDKANEKAERERNVLGDKVERTGKDIKGEETIGEKLSNMGKNVYEGAADMADSAAKKLGLKENEPTVNY